jgi:hypothetical protein
MKIAHSSGPGFEKACGAPIGAVTSPPAETSTSSSALVNRIVPDTRPAP